MIFFGPFSFKKKNDFRIGLAGVVRVLLVGGRVCYINTAKYTDQYCIICTSIRNNARMVTFICCEQNIDKICKGLFLNLTTDVSTHRVFALIIIETPNSFTDTNAWATLCSILNSTTGKYRSVAFI